MPDCMISTYALSKQFNGKGGCRDITLQVPKGVVYGFIGPNGAGKSTFVRTLLGLLQPTSGSAELLGKPLSDITVRGKIGYLPELFRYPDWLTGLQLLQTHADLTKLKKSERNDHFAQLIEMVGLRGRENEKIIRYSKGMQQRIGLACALLGDPDLIFLDEPTSALDPIGRIEVRNLIAELRSRGKTVFLNSHLLMEIETICDQVAIIHKGDLIIQGDWRKLCSFNQRYQLAASGLDPQSLSHLSNVLKLEKKDQPANQSNEDLQADNVNEWSLEVSNSEDIPGLIAYLAGQGVRIYEVTRLEPHLEEIFMYWIERREMENVDDRQIILERNHL